LVFGIVSDSAGVSIALYAIAALALATLPLAALLRRHLAG
jgi:hypothetical protein